MRETAVAARRRARQLKNNAPETPAGTTGSSRKMVAQRRRRAGFDQACLRARIGVFAAVRGARSAAPLCRGGRFGAALARPPRRMPAAALQKRKDGLAAVFPVQPW
ncbi:hypothetical protein [Lysobacter antibioticus]|uniref:hypothetical protein n=1 Tax=Lysobacter antibioticus TaxID=84531 RepID=UPI00126A36DB|nr:hypothetical protein [Lysobacter antibioticus]